MSSPPPSFPCTHKTRYYESGDFSLQGKKRVPAAAKLLLFLLFIRAKDAPTCLNVFSFIYRIRWGPLWVGINYYNWYSYWYVCSS